MKIHFSKYHGTGNDFIIIDNRDGNYDAMSQAQVSFLCNRRFGIGADGLVLLNDQPSYDFEMKYFNADGKAASMCGNGGRCLVRFANEKGIVRSNYKFIAVDGEHEATLNPEGTVALKMNDVNQISYDHGNFILNTGSPHY